MIKFRVFQVLRFIVLSSKQKRGVTRIILLALLVCHVPLSSVYAIDESLALGKGLREPDGLERALQTKIVNPINPAMQPSLSKSGTNASINVSTIAANKEKTAQSANIANAPTSSTTNNLGKNLINAPNVSNTLQHNGIGVNMPPAVNASELHNPVQPGQQAVPVAQTMPEESKSKVFEVVEETTNGLQATPEAKLKDVTVDVPSSASNKLEKTASDKDYKNKSSVKSESDNEAEKTAVTAKPGEQEKQNRGKKEKKEKVSTIEKVKGKIKKQTAKKPHAEVNQNEEDEQYTSGSLSLDSLPGKAGILFAENEQVAVSLSHRDINRVSVTDDKIQSINGPAGFYTAKNDPLGSAYIGVNTEKTFTLFASTVKGHQFSLLVTPISSSGKDVVLTPGAPSRNTAQWEASDGYQKVIVSLISSMINNELLQDYAYTPAKRPKSYNFYGVAQVKPIGYYLGANLIGTVSIIKNTTRKPLSLKPSSFYMLGVRAVALSDQTLSPMGSGLLYQIASR